MQILDFVDNGHPKTFEVLDHLLRMQPRADFASGYFNLGGYSLLREALARVPEFRLLLSHPGYLPLDTLGRLEDGTDASKTASIRDRRHQFWCCRRPDRCLHDRHLDTQHVAYWRLQYGPPSYPVQAPTDHPFHT